VSINKEIGIDQIYIVHGITGYEAREKMLHELLGKQFGLDFQFMTESDDAARNDAWIKQYFVPEIRTKLSKGATFCTLVHFLIYEKFLAGKERYAVIFENDVCFLGNFNKEIVPIVKEADTLPQGFIISLENSTLQFPSWRITKKNKHLYKAHKGRCAGAYVIDRKAAENMLNELTINKCAKVIDWWHNELVDKKIVKMYWAHPPITEQGSFNGKLSSSISIRAHGNVRRWKWLLQKFYKMYVIRWFK
jgi:glycosyl transferase, family 25